MPDNNDENKSKKDSLDKGVKVINKVANKNKNGSIGKNDSSSKNSVLFYVLTIITALLLVALIIGGVLFLAIKNNVNGIADSMGDSIESIPVLKMALPDKPDPEDEKNMSEEQVRKKYNQIIGDKDKLDKQVVDLTNQVEQLTKQLSAKDTNASLLQQQKDALEKEKLQLNADNTSLKKAFDDVSAAIANGDTTEFKKYFEKIDPKIAADLYAEILKDEKMSDNVKKYCSIYEDMDASAVASIMEEMGTPKMPLIIEILKNLKKDTSAEILTEMTPAFAATVSERLAKVYNVGASDATKK